MPAKVVSENRQFQVIEDGGFYVSLPYPERVGVAVLPFDGGKVFLSTGDYLSHHAQGAVRPLITRGYGLPLDLLGTAMVNVGYVLLDLKERAVELGEIWVSPMTDETLWGFGVDVSGQIQDESVVQFLRDQGDEVGWHILPSLEGHCDALLWVLVGRLLLDRKSVV